MEPVTEKSIQEVIEEDGIVVLRHIGFWVTLRRLDVGCSGRGRD